MFHPSVGQSSVQPPVQQTLGEVVGFVRGVATLPAVVLPGGPPRGDGGLVRVLPGFQTGDWSTIAIRGYLSGLGYRTQGWGLGTNKGDIGGYARTIAEAVIKDAERTGAAVRLVGWSLGGTISRAVAQLVPDAVRQVVTLGSPVVGGVRYTSVAHSYVEQGWSMAQSEAAAKRRNARGVTVPVTAIYSKDDSIVAWQACLDPNLANGTEHVEVGGTHFELGVSAPVLRQIGRALAE